MDSAKEKDGTQVQNNNFGTFKAFTFIKQSQHGLKLEAAVVSVSQTPQHYEITCAPSANI